MCVYMCVVILEGMCNMLFWIKILIIKFLKEIIYFFFEKFKYDRKVGEKSFYENCFCCKLFLILRRK